MAKEITASNNINLQATPTSADHLITKGYVDTNKLDITLTVSDWVSGSSYDETDYVYLGNQIYHCKSVHTASSSNKPGISNTYWETVTVEDIIDQKIAAATSDRGKYFGTITGDGSTTTFNVVHNLDSMVILTEVYDEDGNTVLPNTQRTNANTIQIQFGQAPANGYVYNVAVTSLTGTTSDVDTVATGFSAHVNAINAHGATATPTANKIAMYGSGGNLISGTPTTATEVANKGYVDSFPLSIHAGMVNLESSTVALQDNVTIYKYTVGANTAFTFSTSSLVRTDGVLTFELYIVMPSTVYTISFPGTVSWLNNEAPSMSTPSKTYMCVFRSLDGGSTWLGSKEGAY